MSTVAEVRRAKAAAERAKAAHEQAQARLQEAIRVAIAARVSVEDLAAETGFSRARIYQIRAGVRTQRKESKGS